MDNNPNVITGILDFSDVRTCNYWREVFVEFLGTFLLCFFGCASVSGQTDGMAGEGASSPSDFLLISLTFGMMVALCVFMFGEISGCHINPAVTIAMLVGRRIKLCRAVGYILAQLLGGVLGVGMLYVIANHEFGSKYPNANAQVGQLSIGAVVTGEGKSPDGIAQLRGMLAELLGTFLLVLVILSCTDGSRAGLSNYGGVPFAIGVAVATSHFGLIRFTGSGINPARSFGSFVISNQGYTAHWIYWAGPILGGILAVVIYDLIMCPFYNCKHRAPEVQVLDNVVTREEECSEKA